MARSHFRDVWRKAIGKAPEVDDSKEILSYRTALVGLILSGLFIFFWLCKTEMNPGVAATFMFFTLILYLRRTSGTTVTRGETGTFSMPRSRTSRSVRKPDGNGGTWDSGPSGRS